MAGAEAARSQLYRNIFNAIKLLVSIPYLLSPSPHQQPRSDREAEFAIILWLQNPPPPPLQKLFHFVSRQQQRSNCRKVKEDHGDTASTDTASSH